MAQPAPVETTDADQPKDVVLTEADIPGAFLEEPLEKHTVNALKWWLLCHGDSAPSLKKMQLVER